MSHRSFIFIDKTELYKINSYKNSKRKMSLEESVHLKLACEMYRKLQEKKTTKNMRFVTAEIIIDNYLSVFEMCEKGTFKNVVEFSDEEILSLLMLKEKEVQEFIEYLDKLGYLITKNIKRIGCNTKRFYRFSK